MKDRSIDILISINDAYVEHAINLLYSLCDHNESFLNIYLIYTNIDDKGLKLIEEFLDKTKKGKLYPIYLDVKELYLPIFISHISIETYFRLYAPFLLPKKLDRILYLDCDIVCVNPLDKLFNMDFENNYLIACENCDDLNIKHNEDIGLPKQNIYFNAGVLLLNLDLIRKDYSFDKINKFLKDNADTFRFQDQDAINKLFYQKIKRVDSCYNYQITQIYKDDFDFDYCYLIHYLSKNKPWDDKFSEVGSDYLVKGMPYYNNVLKRKEFFDFIYNYKDKYKLSVIFLNGKIEAKLSKDIEVLSADYSNFVDVCSKALGQYVVFIDGRDLIEPRYFDVLLYKINESKFDCCFINHNIICNDIKVPAFSKFINKNTANDCGLELNDYIWSFIFNKDLINNLLKVSVNKFDDYIKKNFIKYEVINDVIYYHYDLNECLIKNLVFVDSKPFVECENILYLKNINNDSLLEWVDRFSNDFNNTIFILYDDLSDDVLSSLEMKYTCIKRDSTKHYLCDRLFVSYNDCCYPKNLGYTRDLFLYMNNL